LRRLTQALAQSLAPLPAAEQELLGAVRGGRQLCQRRVPLLGRQRRGALGLRALRALRSHLALGHLGALLRCGAQPPLLLCDDDCSLRASAFGAQRLERRPRLVRHRRIQVSAI
jgi:hypothetical protein